SARASTWSSTRACTPGSAAFGQGSQLMQQRRVHTGLEPFVRSDCGKFFSDSSTCIQHRRMHAGERPHKCTACGKSSWQHRHRLRHPRTH
ncbi:ZN252 protein, partial [Regulus satrapa]|nr:ZN252 protein [Regulus satrapa]